MPGKLEGFAPNLFVKVAPAYHRHRVGWGHRRPRAGHEALLAFPLATFAFAFTLAGLGKGTLLASWACHGYRRRCRRRLLLCYCYGRLEVVKGKTFTTNLEITTRLDDVLAKPLEEHSALVFGGLLALLKQLLGSQAISWCSEAIKSSVKKHLEY